MTVAMHDGTILYYLLSDHLGSTTVTTDASGNLVSELRYSAWGGVRYTSGTAPKSVRIRDLGIMPLSNWSEWVWNIYALPRMRQRHMPVDHIGNLAYGSEAGVEGVEDLGWKGNWACQIACLRGNNRA